MRATPTDDPSKSGTASVTVQEKTLSDITSIYNYLFASSGGAITAVPVSLNVQLNLDDPQNWSDLMDVIQAAGKFVALDLSACTISGTEFDPGTTYTGKTKIVSLVLPDAVTSIKAGDSNNPSFKDFSALTSVSGSAVEYIRVYAFCYYCTTLRTVSFPAAMDIGAAAFSGCTALTTVRLPKASSIGGSAFSSTGGSAITITLGSVAPTLGRSIFYYVNNAKTATVKVPSNATGYSSILPATYSSSDYTVCLGNGFRGMGWDGENFTGVNLNLNLNLNSNITLTIQVE